MKMDVSAIKYTVVNLVLLAAKFGNGQDTVPFRSIWQ